MAAQEFHPDRFTQLHNSLHQAITELFGRHRDHLEERLDKLERIIMTGFTDVEAEVAKVKQVVTDLRAQISALSTGGGATSAQLDQVISDLDTAIAAPVAPPVTDPTAGGTTAGTTAPTS